MRAVGRFGLMVAFLASPASAQSTGELLKLSGNLNDMCRDGVGTKTGEACESRDLVDQILKRRNICFGLLGKVQRCRSADRAVGGNPAPAELPSTSHEESCQGFAENEIVEAKGFLVAFDYAAEETKPTKVTAVLLDKPMCFEKEKTTKLRIIMLNVTNSKLLGRHCLLKMRMLLGDSWSGSVRAISENKEIPE